MKKKIAIFIENKKTDGGSYTQSQIAIDQFIRLFSNNYNIDLIYSDKINSDISNCMEICLSLILLIL